jgi:parallel beta-helix repeat protein
MKYTHYQGLATKDRGKIALFLIAMVFALAISLGMFSSVKAASTCVFSDAGSVRTLLGDCTTDTTISIPDGVTLNGNGHTITAVDPAGDHFKGAVVGNAGDEAHVTRLNVTVSGLSNVCDGDGDRLRGIMFDGASGSITHSSVNGINQGPSGCQEGNAVEVRNAPFDGTHLDTQTVAISHNVINDYQKTGIVANGDVDVTIEHNRISESATQDNLAANSIQLGFGAIGEVTQNQIEGNQWKGTSDFAATAILIFDADGVNVSNNNVSGNSDIGLYLFGDDATVDNNRVFDEGADHPSSGYDIGVGNYGSGNSVTKNKVKGFDTAYDDVAGGKNITIPGPQKGNPSF